MPDEALRNAAERFQMPARTAELARVKMILTMVEQAMRIERIPEPSVRRVINTLVWGHPAGEVHGRVAVEHERAMLLDVERVMAAFAIPDDLAEGWARIRAGETVPADTAEQAAAVSFSVNDRVWCPSVGLDGQIMAIEGDRAQVEWSDDRASWELVDDLRPPIR